MDVGSYEGEVVFERPKGAFGNNLSFSLWTVLCLFVLFIVVVILLVFDIQSWKCFSTRALLLLCPAPTHTS